MADNVTLNAGSGGDVVATEDIAGVEYQKVKLVDGTAASTTAIPLSGDLTNGLDVDVTRVQGNVTVDLNSVTPDLMLGTDFSSVLGAANLVATDGSAALTIGLQALGTDGTNAQILSTNTSGHVNIADGGNTITVDGTVAATQSGTWNITNISGTVSLPTGAATQTTLADVETNTDFGTVTGGGTETGALRVTIANNSTGTLTVDGTVTANAGTGTMTVDLGANNDVQGDVAHDTADSGNPLKIGAKVETDIDSVTLAVDGDRTDLYAGRDGILYTHLDGPLENLVTGTANSTGTGDTSTIASAGAGVKTYLTDIVVTNASATDTEVIIKDGSTEKLRIAAPANGGAVVVGLRSPIAGSAATAWNFASVDAVTTMYVTMSGFTSQV